MSIYAVNKVCRRLFHDDAFRAALEADPDRVLPEMGVDAQEARLLRAGEVGRLFELGAHAFLLGHLTRKTTFGITVARYSASMRAARDDRLPPLEAAEYMRAKA